MHFLHFLLTQFRCYSEIKKLKTHKKQRIIGVGRYEHD